MAYGGKNVDSCQSVFLLVLQAIVKSNTPMRVLSYHIVVSKAKASYLYYIAILIKSESCELRSYFLLLL